MTDPFAGLTMRRFRNDTGTVVVAPSIGHSISPGQDIQVLMDPDVPAPNGLTETTNTARFAQVAAEAVEHEVDEVAAAPEGEAAEAVAPEETSTEEPAPPPVEEAPAEAAPETDAAPEPPEVVA